MGYTAGTEPTEILPDPADCMHIATYTELACMPQHYTSVSAVISNICVILLLQTEM